MRPPSNGCQRTRGRGLRHAANKSPSTSERPLRGVTCTARLAIVAVPSTVDTSVVDNNFEKFEDRIPSRQDRMLRADCSLPRVCMRLGSVQRVTGTPGRSGFCSTRRQQPLDQGSLGSCPTAVTTSMSFKWRLNWRQGMWTFL